MLRYTRLALFFNVFAVVIAIDMSARLAFQSVMTASVSCMSLAALAVQPPVEPAPRFHAESMDGETFSNESLQGKVVLLQFWATWCKFCRGDQPVVDEFDPGICRSRPGGSGG